MYHMEGIFSYFSFSFFLQIQISPQSLKCYATSSQIDRSATQKLLCSRGKPPLHYINEQLLDDSNVKTSFLYI